MLRIAYKEFATLILKTIATRAIEERLTTNDKRIPIDIAVFRRGSFVFLDNSLCAFRATRPVVTHSNLPSGSASGYLEARKPTFTA